MGEQNGVPSVSVIGLGRFGTFWSEHLSQGTSVVATSRHLPEEAPTGVHLVSLEQACRCEVIFLTVAISALPEVIGAVAKLIRADATVVDTCSVKSYPVRQMELLLPPSVDIIACHPMFGPDSARERTDLLPVITWPVRDHHRRYTSLLRLFEGLRMRVIEMSPDEHDREAAFSQGVTHLVGRVLKAMELQESEIATLGYTRLRQVMNQTCNDPLTLFRDLQHFNPYTRQMRKRFAAALRETEELLTNLDHPGKDR